MKQTRRNFVGTAAALGALATAAGWSSAGAATEPVRLSLAEFVKDPVRLASLRRGVAAMKALPPSDHRSWFWQAATHAYNDALYSEALARDPKVAGVNAKRYWNQCPHFGQCSADFLIWHRAFLFNFEHILRDASGDPAFALPYWDYSTPEGRAFPEAFAAEYLDGAKKSPNPLFHPTRNYDFTSGDTMLSDMVAQASRTMSAPNFYSAPGQTGFAGDFADKGAPVSGLIETRPHGDIHMVVGGWISGINANGAMSDIPTAAFDPVFWVHHANVDRLWVSWAQTRGKTWGPMPSDAWLDEKPWVFVDVNGNDVGESRRFYLERANLDVRYDIDDPAKLELALPPRRYAVGGALAGTMLPAAPKSAPAGGGMSPDMMQMMFQQIELAADYAPVEATPNAAVTREIGVERRSAPHRHMDSPGGSGNEEMQAAAPPEIGRAHV